MISMSRQGMESPEPLNHSVQPINLVTKKPTAETVLYDTINRIIVMTLAACEE